MKKVLASVAALAFLALIINGLIRLDHTQKVQYAQFEYTMCLGIEKAWKEQGRKLTGDCSKAKAKMEALAR